MNNNIESLDNKSEPTNKRNVGKNNIWLILITILLFLSLLLNTYQLISPQDESDILPQAESDISPEREAAIESAVKLLNVHKPIVSKLESDYSSNVYKNLRVDNINKQLLMSQEFTFITLQLIAEQNLIIIELLSTLD